jgi:putative endonuclease
MNYQVYIIQNLGGKRYIGLSEDVSKRVNDHNDGVSKWTKGKGPWSLHWTSRAISLTDARKLENLMKKQKGGDGLLKLMSEYGS